MSMGMGMGQMGGAFLLLNYLSTQLHGLLTESATTVAQGYQQLGIVGLIRSKQLRVLLRRYLWLAALVVSFERVRGLWRSFSVVDSVTQCELGHPILAIRACRGHGHAGQLTTRWQCSTYEACPQTDVASHLPCFC